MLFRTAKEGSIAAAWGKGIGSGSDEIGQGRFSGTTSADDRDETRVERNDRSLQKTGFGDGHLRDRLRRNGAGRGFTIDKSTASGFDTGLPKRLKREVPFDPAKSVEVRAGDFFWSMSVRSVQTGLASTPLRC